MAPCLAVHVAYFYFFCDLWGPIWVEDPHSTLRLDLLCLCAFSRAPSKSLRSCRNLCVIFGKLYFSLIVTIISTGSSSLLSRAKLSRESEYFVSLDKSICQVSYETKKFNPMHKELIKITMIQCSILLFLLEFRKSMFSA